MCGVECLVAGFESPTEEGIVALPLLYVDSSGINCSKPSSP
jgi:hypothetical protein